MKLNFRNTLLLLCIASAAIVSCKKDNASQTPQVPKIKTATYSNNSSETYYYDDKGRVTKIAYSTGERTEYKYSSDSIVLTFYSNANANLGAQTYKLNSAGLAISSSSTGTSITATYDYTADGYLQTYLRRIPQASGIDQIQKKVNYNGANTLDSSIFYTISGTHVVDSSLLYYDEYYTDKLSTIKNENFGMSFLGNQSRNPVKKTHSGDPTRMETAVFTYTYDSQNRLIQQTEQETINGAVYTSTSSYTYY